MTDIKAILQQLVQRHDLSTEAMTTVMQKAMTGKISEIELAAFLTALRIKGETVTEITAAVNQMLQFAEPIPVDNRDKLVDIVGTGGDASNTFNISTISAFVIACAGAKVAKIGNRSVSSKSGSADLLERAGANIKLNVEEVKLCLDKLDVAFLFAPQHHLAMRHVAEVRKQLGFRSLFNLIGPLTNPARPANSIIGVYDKTLLLPIAEVCQNLGYKHCLIVHSEDGLDEFSISDITHVAELQNDRIRCYTINPKDFDIQIQNISAIQVNDSAKSLLYCQQVLDNVPGAARDIVALNSGAGIYVAGLADTLADGIKQARTYISNGAAKEKFERYIKFTQELAHE